MFSVPKLLLLFGLLWTVWLVFRLIDRRNQARNTDTRSAQNPGTDQSVDLTECDRCAAYVSASGCDKADCPLKS